MNVIGQLIFGIYQHNPYIQKLLKLYGNNKIIEMTIYRKPVQKTYLSLLNIMSFGVFEYNFKKSGYDNLFHLYMIIRLDNGLYFKIEKNQRINIDQVNPETNNIEHIIININNSLLSMNILLENTQKQLKNNFYIYTADRYNCQNFIMNILQSNNLLNNDNFNFIYQDTRVLFKNLQLLKKSAQIMTKTAARFDVLIKGGNIIL